VSELELVIFNLQRDLSLKTKVNDKNVWNLVASAECPVLKPVSLELNACFGSTCPYLSESEFSTMETLMLECSILSLTDKRVNDSKRVAITKYTPNYNKLAEGIQC
jgi:hypothetical protein